MNKPYNKSKPEVTPMELYGVTVAYASVHAPNPVSNKYEITITNLTEEQRKMFTSLGPLWNEVKLHNKHPEFGYVVKIKSKDPLLQIIDSFGNPVTELVGNGSICDIKFIAYPQESVMGGTKIQTKLKSLRINELVPYTSGKGSSTF